MARSSLWPFLLNGDWKYKVGASMMPAPGQTFVRWKAGDLYNAMIATLSRYKIKGFIWYQGEANTSKPEEYYQLMSELILDWRKAWGQASLPFLFVQLPGYMEPDKNPSESQWAELRAAQDRVSKIKNTAMALAIDLGEWNDIYSSNKRDVGMRLALKAEKLIYKTAGIVDSGPIFKAVMARNDTMVVSFQNSGRGLIAKNGKILKGFAVAGPDKRYQWAKAIIRDNQILVWSEEVSQPVFIRYA